MYLRKTFLKPIKKLKDKLRGRTRKRDGGSGSEDSGSGRGSDVGRSEASQRGSYLYSEVDIGGTAESGPGREETNVDGKKTVLVDADPPAIPHIGEPESR